MLRSRTAFVVLGTMLAFSSPLIAATIDELKPPQPPVANDPVAQDQQPRRERRVRQPAPPSPAQPAQPQPQLVPPQPGQPAAPQAQGQPPNSKERRARSPREARPGRDVRDGRSERDGRRLGPATSRREAMLKRSIVRHRLMVERLRDRLGDQRFDRRRHAQRDGGGGEGRRRFAVPHQGAPRQGRMEGRRFDQRFGPGAGPRRSPDAGRPQGPQPDGQQPPAQPNQRRRPAPI